MIRSVLKYNFFKWISGLHRTSEKLAGRNCLLDRGEGLTYSNQAESLRRNGICVLRKMGNRLLKSGKFPSLARIDFPENPGQVRDFIRLVVRTKASISEAASESGVKVQDLSKFQVKL